MINELLHISAIKIEFQYQCHLWKELKKKNVLRKIWQYVPAERFEKKKKKDSKKFKVNNKSD